MDLVRIDKIRVGLEERLREKGFTKTYLSLEFGFFGKTIKVESNHDFKDKWYRQKKLIKFKKKKKIDEIDDVTYIQNEVNHLESLIWMDSDNE